MPNNLEIMHLLLQGVTIHPLVLVWVGTWSIIFWIIFLARITWLFWVDTITIEDVKIAVLGSAVFSFMTCALIFMVELLTHCNE